MISYAPLAAAAAAGTSLTGSLAFLDCQVNGAVANGYVRVFGADGASAVALSIGLTLYLTVMAVGLLAGHERLTSGALRSKALTLGFVLSVAVAWPAYQAVAQSLLVGGPDQVAQALLGAPAGATQAFAARLDGLFDSAAMVGGPFSSDLATDLLWSSATLLLTATLGLLVAARLVLAALFALGPIFILFALFDNARGVFEGWLKAALGFALAPLLVVLGGCGLVALVDPVIGAVIDDPVGAVIDMRLIVALFVISASYAAMAAALVWAGVALGRGRTTRGARAGDAPTVLGDGAASLARRALHQAAASGA
jgi:type IV secretion system protein VirB6